MAVCTNTDFNDYILAGKRLLRSTRSFLLNKFQIQPEFVLKTFNKLWANFHSFSNEYFVKIMLFWISLNTNSDAFRKRFNRICRNLHGSLCWYTELQRIVNKISAQGTRVPLGVITVNEVLSSRYFPDTVLSVYDLVSSSDLSNFVS